MMEDNNDVAGVEISWQSSSYELFDKKKKIHEEIIQKEFISYNQSLALRPQCFNTLQGKGHLSCNCLSVLLKGEGDCFFQAVAEYQLMFGKLTKEQQKTVVIEWMRNMPSADFNQQNKRFAMPFVLQKDDNTQDSATTQ
jgi:hypothetical protein